LSSLSFFACGSLSSPLREPKREPRGAAAPARKNKTSPPKSCLKSCCALEFERSPATRPPDVRQRPVAACAVLRVKILFFWGASLGLHLAPCRRSAGCQTTNALDWAMHFVPTRRQAHAATSVDRGAFYVRAGRQRT